MGQWRDRLKKSPVPWLLEKACPAIKLRTLVEIEGRPPSDPDVAFARQEAYRYKPATVIAGDQSDDGTWFHSLIGFEPRNKPRRRGPGTTHQFYALSEYGWDKDHPIVWRSAELFQALLHGTTGGVDLYELKGYCGAGGGPVEVFLRRVLARSALSLLVRAGFDNELVQRKTAELIDELSKLYDADTHEKLYTGTMTRTRDVDSKTTVEESCALLAEDVLPPNDLLWRTLAFAPATRATAKGRALVRRIADYMFSTPPPNVEVVSVCGKVFECDGGFQLRTRSTLEFRDARTVGRLLFELELLARAGVLLEVPQAVEALEWLIGLADDDGIIRAEDYIEKFFNPVEYAYFPLEENWRGKHKKFTDVTFRLLLILTLLDQGG